jgi:hypothetical protein
VTRNAKLIYHRDALSVRPPFRETIYLRGGPEVAEPESNPFPG